MLCGRRGFTRVGLSSALAIVLTGLAGGTSASKVTLPSLASPIQYPSSIIGASAVQGPITSPGGPYLYDRQGRVVFFHGVNAVSKHAPYELYPAPGKPWNFTAADASLMVRLGFNVVRLGMTWKGLEPGTAPANDPAICTPGPPHDPGQFNQAVLDRYLNKLSETVDLLGRFHIYTILDMHQDVYNEMFDGEGAPNWAACTDGIRNTDPPGRWSRNYGTAAADAAGTSGPTTWSGISKVSTTGSGRRWPPTFGRTHGSSVTTRSMNRSRPRSLRAATNSSIANLSAFTPAPPRSAWRSTAPR